MGIANHTNLSYGTAMTIMSIVVLVIDLLLHERIGYGTIIDALLTGNLVQLYNDMNPVPLNENIWIGIIAMLIGFVFMALGMRIYGSCTVLWTKGFTSRRSWKTNTEYTDRHRRDTVFHVIGNRAVSQH